MVDAQQESLARQPFVRNLYRANELSDSNPDCFTTLTMEEIQTVIDFCENTQGLSPTAQIWRGHVFRPRKHPDWLCSQKRPLDALFEVLEEYRTSKTTKIPSYLAIIPDDTYINTFLLRQTLQQRYPSHQPYYVAGCQLEFLKAMHLAFPHWGYGSFFSRAAIQRLLHPIHCDANARNPRDSAALQNYATLACARLEQNAMGEHQFFREGMPLYQLMFRYSTMQHYTDAMSWNAGFCFSAEQALAYFVQHYHVTVPDSTLQKARPNAITDATEEDLSRTFLGVEPLSLAGGWDMKGECTNEGRDQCSPSTSIVCHKMDPESMRRMQSHQ